MNWIKEPDKQNTGHSGREEEGCPWCGAPIVRTILWDDGAKEIYYECESAEDPCQKAWQSPECKDREIANLKAALADCQERLEVWMEGKLFVAIVAQMATDLLIRLKAAGEVE